MKIKTNLCQYQSQSKIEKKLNHTKLKEQIKKLNVNFVHFTPKKSLTIIKNKFNLDYNSETVIDNKNKNNKIIPKFLFEIFNSKQQIRNLTDSQKTPKKLKNKLPNTSNIVRHIIRFKNKKTFTKKISNLGVNPSQNKKTSTNNNFNNENKQKIIKNEKIKSKNTILSSNSNSTIKSLKSPKTNKRIKNPQTEKICRAIDKFAHNGNSSDDSDYSDFFNFEKFELKKTPRKLMSKNQNLLETKNQSENKIENKNSINLSNNKLKKLSNTKKGLNLESLKSTSLNSLKYVSELLKKLSPIKIKSNSKTNLDEENDPKVSVREFLKTPMKDRSKKGVKKKNPKNNMINLCLDLKSDTKSKTKSNLSSFLNSDSKLKAKLIEKSGPDFQSSNLENRDLKNKMTILAKKTNFKNNYNRFNQNLSNCKLKKEINNVKKDINKTIVQTPKNPIFKYKRRISKKFKNIWGNIGQKRKFHIPSLIMAKKLREEEKKLMKLKTSKNKNIRFQKKLIKKSKKMDNINNNNIRNRINYFNLKKMSKQNENALKLNRNNNNIKKAKNKELTTPLKIKRNFKKTKGLINDSVGLIKISDQESSTERIKKKKFPKWASSKELKSVLKKQNKDNFYLFPPLKAPIINLNEIFNEIKSK